MLKQFDPRQPDVPFPGLGLLDLASVLKHVSTLGESDRHALASVARQAEAWQRRTARLALAGAEVSKAMAEMVVHLGTDNHEQMISRMSYALAEYLVAQTSR